MSADDDLFTVRDAVMTDEERLDPEIMDGYGGVGHNHSYDLD
jgi:hypothetical protein